MAPEALLVAAKGRGSFVSWQADMFSVGITALQLLGGQVPLEKMLPESDNICFFDLGFELYGDAEVRESLTCHISPPAPASVIGPACDCECGCHTFNSIQGNSLTLWSVDPRF